MSVVGEVEDYAQYNDIIRDELNVKECKWTQDFTAYETIHYKLNYKTAGAAFGSQVHKVKDYVTRLSEAEQKALQLTSGIAIDIDHQQLTLLKSHVLKESVIKEHYLLAEENGCRVLLNTQLTNDLL